MDKHLNGYVKFDHRPNVGIKTLSPTHAHYSPDYDGGMTYHQGPEWVWPKPHFLKSLLRTSVQAPAKRVRCEIRNYFRKIEDSRFCSLVELNNAGERPCARSCESQCWSIASLADLIEFFANEYMS